MVHNNECERYFVKLVKALHDLFVSGPSARGMVQYRIYFYFYCRIIIIIIIMYYVIVFSRYLQIRRKDRLR